MAVKTKPQSTQACNSAKVVSSLHNPDLMSHNLTMYLSRFLSSFLPRVIASVASGSFVRDIGLRYFCKAAQTMFFVKSAIEIKLSDRWKKIKKRKTSSMIDTILLSTPVPIPFSTHREG